MTRWPQHSYTNEAHELGIPEEVIRESLRQAYRLQDRNLPPILSLKHLCRHTNIPYWKMRAFVARNIIIKAKDEGVVHKADFDPYRTFVIRKKTGKSFRRICVPEPDLLKVQKWIDRFILSSLSASSYSYAFDGKRIIDCAEQHLGCRWLIKIDMRNFFESLTEIQVYKIFKGCGYNGLVSFELARICTKASSYYKDVPFKWTNKKNYSIQAYKYPIVGHLPQGAPTSPKLANLIMKSLDFEIVKSADKYGLTYTRYADDMMFSTDSQTFNREDAKKFIHTAYNMLPRYGLRPNPQKIQIIPPGARKTALGLLIDGKRVRLTKEFRSALECHWYFCVKDPVQHTQKRQFNSLFGLKNYLTGLIAYARQIDSEFVDGLIQKYGNINWPI
jgi:RNA-directed DNA polymerase